MRYRKNNHFLRRRRQTIARPALRFPVPIPPGSARAPPSAPPRPNAAAPCWWSGTSNRRNPGSSSPTCLQRKSASVGTLCASGSNWGFKAIKSLGWQWDKTRRTDPARISRHWLVLSVATLLALAYGTRVEDAQDRRIAPGNLRTPPQDSGFQSPGPSEPSGAHRQRHPLRHRLAEAFAAQRTPLEPRLAAARTLATTQVQPGGHASCALVTALTYPCQLSSPRVADGVDVRPMRLRLRSPPRRQQPVELYRHYSPPGLPRPSWPCGSYR